MHSHRIDRAFKIFHAALSPSFGFGNWASSRKMAVEINRVQLCARYRAERCVTGEFFNMAQVYPFPAYRYNAGKVSYDRVLTQPYDKISPAMQDKYYAADPHNLIAIEKGRVLPGDTPAGVPDEKNVYTRAADALQKWI